MADYSDAEIDQDLVNLEGSELGQVDELSQSNELKELADEHKEDGKGSRDILKVRFHIKHWK